MQRIPQIILIDIPKLKSLKIALKNIALSPDIYIAEFFKIHSNPDSISKNFSPKTYVNIFTTADPL